MFAGCYCDDCVNRVRVGQEKNQYNPGYNNFWCANGGWGQGNVRESACTGNYSHLRQADLLRLTLLSNH